jgi:predicted transcriptional regulator
MQVSRSQISEAVPLPVAQKTNGVHSMNDNADPVELISLTTKITVSYLSGQSVPFSLLPELIRSVHAALSQAGQQTLTKEERQLPAVPIRRSVSPDAITCLECGKRNSMLKRHLRNEHDLSPDLYRAKWGLGADYPMTAPNYAAQRSELAKAHGLGQSRLGKRYAPASKVQPAPAEGRSPVKRGRKAAG